MRYINPTSDRLQIMGTPALTVEGGEEFEYDGTLGSPFVAVPVPLVREPIHIASRGSTT
jgi:hypothetical protein